MLPAKEEIFQAAATIYAKFFPNNQSEKIMEECAEAARKLWDIVERKHGGWG